MVYIVGVGPSRISLLTDEARRLIVETECVVAPPRLAEELALLRGDIISMEIGEIKSFVQGHLDKEIVVLASGDVGFYSISTMIKKIDDKAVLVNGLSSMQYFAALIGINYDNTYQVSLHGRNKYIVGAVSYNFKVFALTGGENRAHVLIKQLCDFGLGEAYIFVGENLSMSSERVIKGKAKDLLSYVFEDLSVMYIINENAANPSRRLRDEDFARGKVPMTKEAVRTLAVSYLEVQKGDIVYDVGSGTGSCSIALAMKATDGVVFAIEKNPEGIELLHKNKASLGVCNIKVVEGYAPLALEDLPSPNRVFVGGSSGNLRSIMELCLKKNPNVEVVVTAIALESIGEGTNVLEELGFRVEVSVVNTSNAQKNGKYTMMKAENPIYIIKGKSKQ